MLYYSYSVNIPLCQYRPASIIDFARYSVVTVGPKFDYCVRAVISVDI
jgi:hypothetical protein